MSIHIATASQWSRVVVERAADTATFTAQSFCRQRPPITSGQPLYDVNDLIPSAGAPISEADADTYLAACVASLNLAGADTYTDYSRFELLCFNGGVSMIIACRVDGDVIPTNEIPVTDENGPIPLSFASALLAAAWARCKAANNLP